MTQRYTRGSHTHAAVFICDNMIFHVSHHTATTACASEKLFCLPSRKLIDGHTTSEETLKNSSRSSPSDDLCHTVHATLTALWLDQKLITSYEVYVYATVTVLSPNKGSMGSNSKSGIFPHDQPLHFLLCHQACPQGPPGGGKNCSQYYLWQIKGVWLIEMNSVQ